MIDCILKFNISSVSINCGCTSTSIFVLGFEDNRAGRGTSSITTARGGDDQSHSRILEENSSLGYSPRNDKHYSEIVVR